MKSFYITAAIPYVNAQPHLGHVLEWFQADAIARYHASLGERVSFTCGTDENSLKNVQAAEKAGKAPQAWLDEYALIFKDAFSFFNISLTHFRRGSDSQTHWPGVHEVWNRCLQAGDIYTKEYTGLYCVGCESYYTPEELIEGNCPEHLKPPVQITETNYFFRLSHYQDQIKQLIETDALKIVSEQYKQEMLGFITQGLEDFSVSRSKERARGVGVPVPNDDSQILYVWFDALSIYLTAVGFGTDPELFAKIWPADVHIIGKGINRFHSIYWIGMLLSAKIPLPKAISVHGYITANGQKMSKSLGNIIDPFDVVKTFGLEPIRYYLLKYIPTHGDGDFSYEKFTEVYTSDLANGIGNLASRVAKLAEKEQLDGFARPTVYEEKFTQLFQQYSLSEALYFISEKVTAADQYLSTEKPWEKSGEERTACINQAVTLVLSCAYHLTPFLPETAEKLLHHFTQSQITALTPLFPRLPKHV